MTLCMKRFEKKKPMHTRKGEMLENPEVDLDNRQFQSLEIEQFPQKGEAHPDRHGGQIVEVLYALHQQPGDAMSVRNG